MLRRATIFAAFALCLGLAPPAQARGDLGLDRDACVLKIGPELMYFTGYQPGASRSKFCEDAPAIGRTIFVFDYAEPELREMKAGFRILRQSPNAEEPDQIEQATADYLAPQVYPKGTFSLEHVFSQPGDFIGVVTVDGGRGEHWESRFPFSVGKTHVDYTPYYLIAAAAALAMMLYLSSRAGPKARTLRPPSARR